MPKLVVRNFTISLDGYSSGPNQALDNPMGEGGRALHGWAFATHTFRVMFGKEGGSTDVDDDFARKGDEGVGATIMGRNMFGPVRGEWTDESWKGWWGDEPPYHHPVFVLTHHDRKPIQMKGGTTFHFVSGGILMALSMAFEAAKGKDVRIGGGADTVRQYLRAGLVDELHLAVSPMLLGRGDRIFEGLSDIAERYRCAEYTPTKAAAHYRLLKK